MTTKRNTINVEAIRKSDREYQARKRKEYPEKKKEENKRYYELNKKKCFSHMKVWKAIHNGKLKKLSCVVCGEIKVHAHHSNYDEPLNVIWLCSVHHKRLHLGLTKQ